VGGDRAVDCHLVWVWTVNAENSSCLQFFCFKLIKYDALSCYNLPFTFFFPSTISTHDTPYYNKIYYRSASSNSASLSEWLSPPTSCAATARSSCAALVRVACAVGLLVEEEEESGGGGGVLAVVLLSVAAKRWASWLRMMAAPRALIRFVSSDAAAEGGREDSSAALLRVAVATGREGRGGVR